MAYNPINWQTGDVITAEKLNKMDNGWSTEDVQLFSETVTTAAGMHGASAKLIYSNIITGDTITVTFNGTVYVCERIESYGHFYYGGLGTQGPDFSQYPFLISTETGNNTIYTENAGTYTVMVTSEQASISNGFKTVINSMGIFPMLCISGITTYEEMVKAQSEGRLLYTYNNETTYVITSFAEDLGASFIPEDSILSMSFSEGVFTITVS